MKILVKRDKCIPSLLLIRPSRKSRKISCKGIGIPKKFKGKCVTAIVPKGKEKRYFCQKTIRR